MTHHTLSRIGWGLLTIIAAWLLVWAAEAVTRVEWRGALERDRMALAGRVAESIDRALFQRQRDIAEVAAELTQSLEAGGKGYVQGFAYTPAERRLFPDGIYLVATDGRMLIAATPDAGVQHMPTGELPLWMRSHLFSAFDMTLQSGNPVIGTAFKSFAGKPAIVFSAPVRTPDGKLFGALAGVANPLQEEIIGGLEVLRDDPGFAFLITRDRLMVAHPDAARLLQRDIAPGVDAALDRALTGEEFVGETGAALGPPALTAFRRIRATSWMIGVAYPLKKVEAPLRELMIKFWLVTAVAVALTLFAIWKYVGRNGNDIRAEP